MKRLSILFGVIATALGAGLLLQVAVQAQSAPMTEAHIERIRSNCIEAQSTLNQLHASDAALRVNRGQLYESISTKLITPFNSRAVLNHLESAALLSIANTYESHLAGFRTNYQQYEEAMSKTLKINCMNQPVAFYDGVGDTRTKRKKVNESTLQLHKSLQDYKEQFEILAKKIMENKS